MAAKRLPSRKRGRPSIRKDFVPVTTTLPLALLKQLNKLAEVRGQYLNDLLIEAARKTYRLK